MELVVAVAADAVRARGVFTVVLSGGTTPKGVYARLADDDVMRREGLGARALLLR